MIGGTVTAANGDWIRQSVLGNKYSIILVSAFFFFFFVRNQFVTYKSERREG